MFTVVFIVKNEHRALPEALASLGDVPEVVVCDTGSSDTTPGRARRWGTRVVHHVWRDDFAVARAFAESHASHEWIVRFDADERFAASVPRLSLREWLVPYLVKANASGAGQVFVRRRYAPGNEHWFPRVHRQGLYRWRYPVHEVLQPLRQGAWPRSIAALGARVDHKRVARPRPYRRILEAAVAQEPSSPHLLFHLGQTCVEEEDFPSAQAWLHRYLDGLPGYRFHWSEAWMLLGLCRASAGDFKGAFDAYEESSRQGPRSEPLWHAARLALRLGRLEWASAHVARGRSILMPRERQPFEEEDHPYVLDRRLYQPAAWDALCEEIALRKGAV
jgi:tetratricopeptide (TPR) repeat protein